MTKFHQNPIFQSLSHWRPSTGSALDVTRLAHKQPSWIPCRLRPRSGCWAMFYGIADTINCQQLVHVGFPCLLGSSKVILAVRHMIYLRSSQGPTTASANGPLTRTSWRIARTPPAGSGLGAASTTALCWNAFATRHRVGLPTTPLVPATGDDLKKCRIRKQQTVEVTYWNIGSPCPDLAELTDHLSC